MADPFTEVLRSIRLKGGVFLDSYFSAPWCVLAKVDAEDCKLHIETPAQMIAYHVVIEGELLLSVDGNDPMSVHEGEVVLLPRNGSDTVFNPLIATLPQVLKIGVQEGTSRAWIEASVRFAAEELTKGNFAASDVMSRLSELLLVEAVRSYASDMDERAIGWLRGLADPYVGRALAAIHRDNSKSWSSEELAREVSLSRSAFVERFTHLVGMPPIRYATLWRLQTARQSLRDTRTTIAQLAHSVGYESEEAFSRAFKRAFGISPGRWRDAEQQRDPAHRMS
jgi:AraC-like DNA-binding protein